MGAQCRCIRFQLICEGSPISFVACRRAILSFLSATIAEPCNKRNFLFRDGYVLFVLCIIPIVFLRTLWIRNSKKEGEGVMSRISIPIRRNGCPIKTHLTTCLQRAHIISPMRHLPAAICALQCTTNWEKTGVQTQQSGKNDVHESQRPISVLNESRKISQTSSHHFSNDIEGNERPLETILPVTHGMIAR